ncbi:hypothetical protein [Brevundimonas sp.]|uniref:hypothetical protein n=1 Tax=Brevundimonas sp. TaxID=1871086 RepID=UPI0028A75CDE|nr:hypothetical protein [Brevundimonas sp.]
MTGRPPTLTTEQIVDGYEVLFDPLMRAAQRACFEKALLTQEGGRPTPADALAFAKLFGVDGAELAAFFGHLVWTDGSRTIWVDGLSGQVSTWLARQRATRRQSIAFGFQSALVQTVRQAIH